MELEDYNKKDSFTTPDGYFEELNNRIMSATCHKSKPKTEKRMFTRIMSYAAMVAVAFMVATGYIYNRAGNNETATANVAEPNEALYDTEFIESMLEEYPIDEYTFYCYMTNTDNNY